MATLSPPHYSSHCVSDSNHNNNHTNIRINRHRRPPSYSKNTQTRHSLSPLRPIQLLRSSRCPCHHSLRPLSSTTAHYISLCTVYTYARAGSYALQAADVSVPMSRRDKTVDQRHTMWKARLVVRTHIVQT
jgi:hypothetical protein